MPKTLLAVDDSATMRKALEITFGVDDYRVITAEGRASALAKLGEQPDVIIIDTFLDPDDGYALAKEIRGKNANALIVMLYSSRFHPYDAAKAIDAGADESMDKPFETQAFIDRVKNALAAKASGTSKPAAAPAAVQAPPPAAAPAQPRPAEVTAKPAPVAAAPQAAVSQPAAMNKTPATPATNFATTTRSSAVDAERPRPLGPSTDTRSAGPLPAEFSSKLGQLGLTAAQVEGVLSLSREVIERVVWEVVPTLAEVIIKEEISRLTRDA